MPDSDTIQIGAGVVDIGGLQPGLPHGMRHLNPFLQAQAPPPQAVAPSSSVHQDTGYETMEQDGSPLRPNRAGDRMISTDSAIHSSASTMDFLSGQLPQHMALPPNAEMFRFRLNLNAPTAMIKNPNEIPVTYLNKGQAYNLSITDTHAVMPIAPGTKFRTFVRISSEDEEQRQKPGWCWSLWKEGRGTNEAHQRGGKLQAVEYVEAGQPAEGDDKRTRVELETSSFDGFSVTWTRGSLAVSGVNIGVRFNFLSTDFSHSKGVKGIPVRLCAKTSIVPSSSPSPVKPAPEICFCKVKLFRDHSAERKLSNDVAHVKKSIDKVKDRISQADSGTRSFKKTKRGALKPKLDSSRASKVPERRRTSSLSSRGSSNGNGRPTTEDDMHNKLQALQDMFSTARPVSLLYLRGEEQDDPDVHPVTIAGESPDPNSDTRANWEPQEKRAFSSHSFSSRSPSPFSMAPQQSAGASAGQYQSFDGTGTDDDIQETPNRPTKIRKIDHGDKLSGWLEALQVDHSYRPPPERRPKPVACFYILCRDKGDASKTGYYRAVYLLQRNLKDFNRGVAENFGLDHTKITQIIHVLQRGLEVEMDDDDIQNLREAQDMVLEIEGRDRPAKQEWEIAVDDKPTQETPHPPAVGGLVLRFTF